MKAPLKKRVNALVAKLKPAERVELADRLYATLPRAYLESVNRAWEQEIDRRLDHYEAGKVKTISSAQVHANVRRRLNEAQPGVPADEGKVNHG